MIAWNISDKETEELFHIAVLGSRGGVAQEATCGDVSKSSEAHKMNVYMSFCKQESFPSLSC